MSKGLVIVESPAKAKTIHKILGKDFDVESSMGHVIDLPLKTMGVDVENQFAPKYTVIAGRKKLLDTLKKKAQKESAIYLATDPDREGEAISYHLARELGKGKIVHRVEFHEITQRAIQEAFKHPRAINENLVNAQQARRILDRIVGYNLSPLLWKKVGRGLSAGRVQSVALRLIVDREREIRAFKSEEYWTLDAKFQKPPAGPAFVARLFKVRGEEAKIGKSGEVDALIASLKGASFRVTSVKETQRKRKPSAPFTTSKLQQEGFNRLRFSSYKTMKVAQQLYEGLEVGEEGSVGLITYMRTDSVRVAAEAIEEARQYIRSKFGPNYLPEKPAVYVSKKTAQEAHEAIRPTSVERSPESIRHALTPDQFKLYELIWRKFLASQMSQASIATTTIEVEAAECLFKATGSKVLFDGFTVLYPEASEEPAVVLPHVTVDEILKLLELLPEQHFTKPPARYTDASLVKMLEEKGIGRPSTYAPILFTLVQRNYVTRDRGGLAPTELGEAIIGLLVGHFPVILDFKFTAGMEEELDEIEQGKLEWVKVLSDFYKPFMEQIAAAQVEMRSLKKETETTSEVCPTCGAPMVIKWSRNGKFLSCSAFPKCRFAKSISLGVACPNKCGGEVVKRRSKRGRFFYGCSSYPKCNYVSWRLPSSEPGKAEGPAAAEPAEETGSGDPE